MNNVINLFTDGEVKSKEKEFTRLVGGFNENDPVITDLQVAELLSHKNGARHVRELISKNIIHFESNVHIMDLKLGVDQTDTLKETLISLGYSKQSLTQSKNIYILSKAGFLLYLKFAEGDKAIEIYKDFLEDYFKTKAENAHMRVGIQEQIEKLKEKKASALGMSFMSQKDEDKARYMNQVEEYNVQILDLEKLLSKEEVIKELQPKLHISELIESAKSNYDLGVFSKVLDTKGLGRNNLFKWLREQKILNKDNIPYQPYMKYFKVIDVPGKNGYKNPKTLLKPNGVSYIVKRLINDSKIVTKSVDQILSELDGEQVN